jgi:membrane protein implicated in regulation of membrane protease activity
MDDEQVWRRRLLVYSAVRFVGLVVFFIGLAVAYSDLVRKGGWPQAGAIIAIVGVIDALFLPRLVKRGWERQDQENR